MDNDGQGLYMFRPQRKQCGADKTALMKVLLCFCDFSPGMRVLPPDSLTTMDHRNSEGRISAVFR